MTEEHDAERDALDQPETWDDYHRRMSSIAAEFVGAARYLADHPEYATTERLAETFRRFADRFTRVIPPEVRD